MPKNKPASIEEAIPGFVRMIRHLHVGVMMQVSLDRVGHVLDVEVLASHVAPEKGILFDLLLERPLAHEASCVTFFSSCPDDHLDEADINFTRRLLREAHRCNLGVVDHQLVGPTRVISVRAETDLW